jgi:hypothetical protein
MPESRRIAGQRGLFVARNRQTTATWTSQAGRVAALMVALVSACGASPDALRRVARGRTSSAGPAAVPPTVICPPFTEIRARLVSGAVSFALDDRPRQTQTLSPSDPPIVPNEGSGRCGFGGFRAQIGAGEAPTAPPGFVPVAGGSFSVECDLGRVTLDAGDSSFDPRGLQPGVYEDLNGGSLTLTKVADVGSCFTSAATAMRVLVIRAVGGPAPEPAGVTPDYEREFEIHIQSLAATGKDQDCPVATSFSADLRFVQTAADVVYQTHQVCGLL